MKTTRIVLASLIFIALISPMKAEESKSKAISPEKKDLVIKFLQVSGTTAIPGQIINDIINNFKSQIAVIPDKFWQEIKMQADTNSYMEMLIPAYDSAFNESDIKDLIKFYESPVGKKFVGVSGRIYEQTYNASQRWGSAFNELILDKMKKAGYLPNNEANPTEQPQQEETK